MLGVPKNGTTTHVVVPSQHKHKIKHDKTTMQSFLSMPVSFIESLFHGVSAASSMQSVKYLLKFLRLSNPALY